MSRSLDSSLDIGLYPSLLLLTSVTLSYIENGRTKLSDIDDLALMSSPSRQAKLGVTPQVKIFDFYRDGFVEEVKQCFPVLTAVSSRVRELLAEWPDHPTLKQVSMRKFTCLGHVLCFRRVGGRVHTCCHNGAVNSLLTWSTLTGLLDLFSY